MSSVKGVNTTFPNVIKPGSHIYIDKIAMFVFLDPRFVYVCQDLDW